MADLLESARRLDIKSRTDLWCGFNFLYVKGNQMKYSVLLAALLAVSMTACGSKEEAPAPAAEVAGEAATAAGEAATTAGEAAVDASKAAEAAAPSADAAAAAAPAK